LPEKRGGRGGHRGGESGVKRLTEEGTGGVVRNGHADQGEKTETGRKKKTSVDGGRTCGPTRRKKVVRRGPDILGASGKKRGKNWGEKTP